MAGCGFGCDSLWLFFFFYCWENPARQSARLGRERYGARPAASFSSAFLRLSLLLSAAPKIPLASPCSTLNPPASLRRQNSMTAFGGRSPHAFAWVCLFVCIFLSLSSFPRIPPRKVQRRSHGGTRRLPGRNCILTCCQRHSETVCASATQGGVAAVCFVADERLMLFRPRRNVKSSVSRQTRKHRTDHGDTKKHIFRG